MMKRFSILAGMAFVYLFSSLAFGNDVPTIKVLSHREPTTELVVSRMQAAPGVKIDLTMMPHPKVTETARITLSAGSDAYDLICLPNSEIYSIAKAGWFEPLDKYMEKYESDFNFKDIHPTARDLLQYEGKVYALPYVVNPQLLFYRKDILQKAGLKPPTTISELITTANKLKTKNMSGLVFIFKPGFGFSCTFQYFLYTLGGRWFDDKWNPVFNNEFGVKTIEVIKELVKAAPDDIYMYFNDEVAVALQQEMAAMGLQWYTRVSAMEDPKVSKVVDKMGYAPMPGLNPGETGISPTVAAGYAISKFSKNKEAAFRTLAYATSAETFANGIKSGAISILAPRLSVGENPEVRNALKGYGAAAASMNRGQTFPRIPEFTEINEKISLILQDTVRGKLESRKGLDSAAKEVRDFLSKRGYYR
jgi:ABC-type glycerol-3-phosphate transport system substrate-binding protein